MSDLPDGWVVAKLADVVAPDAPIIYGILQPGPNLTKGVPYVRPTEIVDDIIDAANLRRTSAEIAHRYRRSTLKPDDVVLSIVGTIGKVAIVPAELDGANITQSSCRLRPNPDVILHNALALFLRSPAASSQFEALSLGTAVPRLNLEDVREIEIPLAPLHEQRRIVDKSDSLSAKSRRSRDQLDRVPGLVEKYKQAILAAAFRGELTRKWRASAGFNDPRQDTSLGQMLVDIRYGTAKKCSYNGGAVGVLRIPNVQHGHIMLDDIKSADFTHSELQALRLEDGDILIIRSNGSLDLVGRSAIVHEAAAGMLFAGYLIRLRVDRALVDPRFIQLYFRTAETRALIERLAKSTSGVNNINGTQIRGLSLLRPGLDEQREIVRRVDAAFTWIDRLASEADNARKLIDQLDQAVIAKAFRGELVSQDPNDEPASLLLERIRKRRADGAVPARNGFKPKLQSRA